MSHPKRASSTLRLILLSAALLSLLVLYAHRAGNSRDEARPDADLPFKPVTLATGLTHPWGMAFLPDGRVLITERPGRLRILDKGHLLTEPVDGLPPIAAGGQGGLLDVVLHPEYGQNGWIYFSYAAGEGRRIGTEVGRGRLEGNRIRDWQTLFRLEPKTGSRAHFGSRLVFDNEGHLFITLGDRRNRHRAQDLGDHAGSVIRLNGDGSVPGDNPFVATRGARPEIYSYGHYNIQGAALHPRSGVLWIHEHGPQGGDEVNIVEPGKNYGWPVITYGKEYGTGWRIGEGTHKPGMMQPIHYWVPSIAPSGMAFYTGSRYPGWENSLLVGSLKFQLLVRLELDGETVVREERMLKGQLGRIRDVRVGPDDLIYLLTDASDGRLVRLEPR
ncbi:MAG: PQQ-dependent sugar dehydrogenase [Pseudomonadota bacterium]